MTDDGFALLERRRLAHAALLVMLVVGAYVFGPPNVRHQLDEWVVTPVSHTARMLWNPAEERDVHPPLTQGVGSQP